MTTERDCDAQGDPRATALIKFTQLVSRPVRPDEIPELRAMWWRQVGLGHRLPAEIGVIVVEGGAG